MHHTSLTILMIFLFLFRIFLLHRIINQTGITLITLLEQIRSHQVSKNTSTKLQKVGFKIQSKTGDALLLILQDLWFPWVGTKDTFT